MVSVRSPRNGRRSFLEAGRGDDVGRRVDELTRGVRTAGDERRALGHRPERVAAADHEALDAARKAAASPPAAVVAADDGAFGQRAHLVLDGDGQRGIEGPGDRPSAPARAHSPRGGGSQPFDVGLERHDGQRSGVRVHHRDRIGLRHRALRRTQLRRPRAGGGYEVGPDRVRVACCYFKTTI